MSEKNRWKRRRTVGRIWTGIILTLLVAGIIYEIVMAVR